jgi:hypothetical protein
MDFPIFKLIIDPDNEVEVNAIALVDRPAIERNFMAFDSQKFQIENEEQRIISGPLMVPDMPIYRNNEEFGEHFVVFDTPTVKQIAINYAKKKYNDQVNLMHAKFIDGVTLFESFLCDKKRGINAMAGFTDLPDGTWFGSMYVENDEAWQQVKDGTFRGFSVEGDFKYIIPKPTPEQLMKKLAEILQHV